MNKKYYGLFWIGLSQLVLLVVNFLLLKILTEELKISEFGFYTLCMSVILFARQIVCDPFSMLIAKEASFNSANQKKLDFEFLVVKFASEQYFILILTLAFISLAMKLFSVFFVDYAAIFACCLLLLSNGALGVYLNVLNAIKERKVAALFLILDAFVKLLIVAFLIDYVGNNANSILTLISIGAFGVFVAIRNYAKKSYTNIYVDNFEIRKKFKHYLILTLPILVPTLFNALKNVGDRWILSAIIGLEGLAAYGVLLQIGFFPIILIIGIIQTYISPKIYEMCISKNKFKIKVFILKTIMITIILCAVSGILANVFSGIMFDFFVGEQYRPYAYYLPIFAVAASISGGAAILQNLVFGYFDTRTSSAIIFIANILGLIFALIFTYFYDFDGAAIGLAVMGLISMILFGCAMLLKIK